MNADDAVHVLRSAIVELGDRGLFTNGIEALAKVAKLQEEGRWLSVLQAWSAATSPDCNTRSVMFVGPTFSLVWEDVDGEGCHREAPSLEAAAGLIELGAL